MSESDYNLKESFEKLGILPLPIFVDQKGKILDGFERIRVGMRGKLPEVTIEVEGPLQEHLIRLALTHCRRRISREEARGLLTSIAELTGWRPKEMAERLPVSYRWIMENLPDRYKERPGIGGPKKKTVAERATKEILEEPTKVESEETFCNRFAEQLKNHVTRVVKDDLSILINHMASNGNCAECMPREACDFFLDLLRVSELPNCMQQRLKQQVYPDE